MDLPNFFFVLYPISILISFLLVLIGLNNRKNPVSYPFILLMSATAIWTAGDWLNIYTSDPFLNHILNSTIYPAIAIVPVAWLITVLYYLDYEHYLNKKRIALLLFIPAVSVIAVLTNPIHHLFYTDIIPEIIDNLVIWHYNHGTLFQLHILYSYLLVIAGSLLILLKMVDYTALYRKQTIILFFSSLIPMAFNIIYVASSKFIPAIDFTPFSFTIVGILMAFGIFRYQLFSSVPLAYESLFSSMHDGVFATDTSFQILDLNPAALTICLPFPGKAIGSYIQEIVPEIGNILSNHTIQNEERKELNLKRDGKENWYELSYHPLLAKNRNQGYIFTFRDINARKKVERKLQESQQKLQLAIDGSHIGIWEYDVLQKTLFINKEFTALFGDNDTHERYNSSELYQFQKPDDEKSFLTFLQTLKMGEQELFKSDFQIKCSDGRWKWILVAGKITQFDENGAPLTILGTSLDISDRKFAEELLEKANKKMNLLSSITRHDILNQVSGLQGYLELSQQMNNIRDIEIYLNKCEAIISTIQNQIEFSRKYEEIGSSSPQWQNISLIIRKVKKDLPNATINYHLETDTLMVYADPLLEKVFFTLVENSLRHGERVSDVSFRYRISESGLFLTYEDNGIGIDEQEKDRVFDKNYGKHTGFGLFLAREVLSITGMSIQETGEKGEGVIFEIFIPPGAWKIN